MINIFGIELIKPKFGLRKSSHQEWGKDKKICSGKIALSYVLCKPIHCTCAYRSSEAAQAAAQAAAKINQQLGVPQNKPPMQSPPDNQMGGGMGGMVVTEEFRVPDRMVGLSMYDL